MRDHLFSLGASAVLALGVALAQDQAPQMQPPLPAAGPARADAVGQKPLAPAVSANPAHVGQRPAAPAPAAVVPQPAAPKVVPAASALSGQRPAAPAPSAVAPQPAAPKVVPAASALSGRRSLLGQRNPGVAAPGASGPAVPPTAAMEPAASAQSELAAGGEAKPKTTTPALKFDSAPADIILQAYAQETGKTLLMAPDAPKANITLKSQPDVQLTKEEYLEAIEVVLSMHGIVLEPFGEKFVKVFARKTVRTEGIKILMDSPEGGYPEKGKVVSQMIQLKAITIAEVQKALEGFKKPDGLIQTFERTNSLLVTDTQENVNRMLEIVKFIDQPLVAMEEVNVRVIRFAKADEIKKRLEELVAESQKQTQAKEEVKANVAGAPGMTRTTGSTGYRPTLPGLLRPGLGLQPAAATPNEVLETLVNDADRGMIRGKVQIIADERSNQLIIVTRQENMNFFDRIITLLDIETAPDVKVEVQRLEYADAEEVSTMLNDLIGNVTAKKDKEAPANAAKGTSKYGAANEPAKSTTLAETLAARAASRAENTTVSEPGKSKLGQLSKENIKILADKRTNALVMMGSVGDLAAIKEIIKGMDVELSQVLIEVVLLEVLLGDDIRTGVDWVQKTVQTQDHTSYAGGGGGGTATPQLLPHGGENVLGAGVSGVKYWFTLDKLNLNAVVSAYKSDSRTKVLQSPVLMTVDNKEASLEATEMAYLYKGVRYSGSQYGGGSEVPDYEQRDFGLTIKVTPRINPKGNVMLTIETKFETRGADQPMPGSGSSTNSTGSVAGGYPTINTRKMQADVSVKNEQTVILGGLTKRESTQTDTGIPVLKDIPYIGRYLFGSTTDSEKRTELMVFLTPYVLTGAEEAQAEARQRKESLVAQDVWTKGWSRSTLADPLSEKELLKQEKRIMDREDQERSARKALEKVQRTREKKAKDDPKEADARPQETLGPKPDATFGVMKETESIEVLKPAGEAVGDGAQPAVAAEPAPVPPPVEEPRKGWWKLV
jgi:general secretion pathway protein D